VEPDVTFSWDVMLFVLAGPLGVLAAFVLLGLLGMLLNRLWWRLRPRPAGEGVVPELISAPTEWQVESVVVPATERILPVVKAGGRRLGRVPRRLGVATLLVIILLFGAYFRFVGLNWDENQHLHPDERFMTMVADRIHSVGSVAEYFDTDLSPLNPFSSGSYTYGMFPLFLTRYVAEWVSMTEYDRIVIVGRALSGLFDLAAVGMLYLLGARLYNRRVGLLAAALSATAVLPIQLSHYFAVDSFATVFVVAAFYVAVRVMDASCWWRYALFGALAGLAMACKISTAPLLSVIGLAGLVHLAQVWRRPAERSAVLKNVFGGWVIAGLMAALFFRVFQPYAFAGPGFFGLHFNQRWLDIMKEVRNQVAGHAQWPPNHHWTNRPMLTFAWTNLAVWGVGLPLGLAATIGWLWAAWRCWQAEPGEWQRHLLLVVWVGGYFAWQNLQFWRYMRYFMPIYPFAILLAAWALVELVGRARSSRQAWRRLTTGRWVALPGTLAVLTLVIVLVATCAYAYAFTRIYTRPHTRVEASRWILNNVPGPLNVIVESPEGSRQYPLSVPYDHIFRSGGTWGRSFTPVISGTVTTITTMHIDGTASGADVATLQVTLARDDSGREPLAVASTTVNLAEGSARPTFEFSPVAIQADETYFVILEVIAGGPLTLGGSRLVWETSWDDALPLRVDGYDPLGGIYKLLNLKLFEPDTVEKRERMLEIVEQADYIFISSNRAYDAMPRLPLRYPLTLKYYQLLFDCPTQRITDCAYPAAPPLSGALGFDLVTIFESNPTLGPFSISDQTAEEAFTVYDHPKVLIFKKAPDFMIARARDTLEGVDLSGVIEQGPREYTDAPTALRLPADRWERQTTGGTWSEMFDPSAAINSSQPLGILAWYGVLLALGWLVFPLVFMAFSGLPDRGYPVARLVGLLAVAWLAWIGASCQVAPFTRITLWLCAAGLAVVSGLVARLRWRSIKLFIRTRWRYILVVEGLFLALFLFVLVVRWHNPDLWQPWKGGEKPMDLAYFNAVLKSTTFPPHDPWFSEGYLNYYYYGYVLVGVLTKMVGVVPAFAYNLALPTWFALTGIGAFCVAYNLGARSQPAGRNRKWPYVAGIAALVLMVFLGNLFEVRLLWQRLAELSFSHGAGAPWYEQVGDVLVGFQRVILGEAELIGEDQGRWYFSASRAILHNSDGTPITEFPYFSFLYADLHPHTMDMPVMLAGLAWMLSFVLAAGRVEAVAWLVAGLVFGATYPTHTWDFPTFVGMGALAVGYAVWQGWREPLRGRATVLAIAGRVLLLIVLAVGMYAPFRQWFGSSYVSAELWRGPRTPLGDYMTVHGLFLFVLVTFLAVQSAGWVRAKVHTLFYTPLGVLVPVLWRNLRWIVGGGIVALWGVLWLWRNDYQALILALPLVVWVALLLLRRDQSPRQLFVLALVGAGVGLTLAAEVFTLKGDVGRSNTVFKFYIQVWIFFSVAAGAALAWLLPRLQRWSQRWRRAWLWGLALLVLGAGAYPVLATPTKAGDRWPDISDPPRTWDGMAYMLGDGANQPAIYRDEGRPIDLTHDHAAIRWMQDNVSGTPVIVEGQTVEYRWGSRFAIYTGLPTVVGWSWHLRQHNSVVPGQVVEQRIEEVKNFYNTVSVEDALAFLRRYRAQYIVVGQLERIYYADTGLAKFPRMVEQGELQLVFSSQAGRQDTGTIIYQVSDLGRN